MGHSWISIAGWGTLGLTCLLAWVKGSLPERLGAILVLTIDLASDLAMAVSFPHTPGLLLFVLDLLLAVGLLLLALRFSSLWLGLAMILQSLALLAHGVRLGQEGVDTYHWMVFNNVISQLMLACIVTATAISWRARSRKPKPPAFYTVPDPTPG